MNTTISQRLDALESNALGCLRKGNPEAAAEYLRIALLYEKSDRIISARIICGGRFWNHAICLLDGHNYEGGATCLHCAKPLTTYSVAGGRNV